MVSLMERKNLYHMSDSPLVYMLGQVTFPTILKMEAYIPSIQEKLRKSGFPGYEESMANTITINREKNSITSADTTRWDFFDKEKSTGIILNGKSISIHTTNYDSFERIIDKLDYVLKAIQEIVDITLVERVGLRYVNMVTPDNDEAFEDYLKTGLMGFPFNNEITSEPDKALLRSESIAKTSCGVLAIRCIKSNQGEYVSPDLMPINLKITQKPENGEMVAFLDFDHFSVGSQDFDVDSLIDGFWNLHKIISVAFLSSIQDYAIKKWGYEKT